MFTLSDRSNDNLLGVHPDLIKVVRTAAELSPVVFVVTEGLRTEARQKQLVRSGASKTMNSRHLTGHAVDLAATVEGKVSWDWPLYYRLADTMKMAAESLDIPIEWGGDWTTFKDGPHFQLPWKEYPINEPYPIPESTCTTQTLKLNSQGACVGRLQEALVAFLIDHDFTPPIKVDGDFGRETADFVTFFKRIHHLSPTSAVTPATWEYLEKYLS